MAKVRTAKKPAPAKKPKKTTGRAVRVRMYRQGLGDCFLLSFPRDDGGECHVLVDCGVILGTKDPVPKLKQVVDDVAEETGNHLDVVVATHEHWDHLSGFVQAREEFEKLKIDGVWMGWTEDPHDEEAQQLGAAKRQKLAALQLGLGRLGARLGSTDDSARALAEQARQVLSFFGIDPDAPAGALGAAGGSGGTMADATAWLQKKGPHYCRPGDVLRLPGVSGVRVYVLGPPTDLAKLHKLLPSRTGNETYGVALRADDYDGAFFGALFPPPAGAADGRTAEERSAYEHSMPFGPGYRISEEQARKDPFFQDYFGTPGNDPEGWRRIGSEWLSGAAELALQLDSYTNNTSLALAFELADGRVLLFPGDAQVGNWLSWHDVKWKEGKEELPATARSLLNRTVLYKVGHHGSHNATLREKGLEMMIDRELTALLPVDEEVAHNVKHWMKMPFEPLLAQLGKKTDNRIYWSDRQPAAPPAQGRKDQGTPGETAAQVEFSTEKLVKSDGRALYVEYTLPL